MKTSPPAALPGQAEVIGRDPPATIRFLELGLLHGLPLDAASWEAVRAVAAAGSSAAGERDANDPALPSPAASALASAPL